ncbi:antibiotic biosynthesis monooxygenase [Streptomyces sp. NPDC004327]|uniref:antibiotic biosynthesis monooxygenase n=1 Tax=Streptomyces sp. NPDC004327 TaxID=3364699 RepID=UPI0036A36826
MYVRTIYMTGDPAQLDDVAESVRSEGRELLSGQRGYRGMGVFVDRTVGKLLVGSWWEDEASRQASEEALRARRTEMFAPFSRTGAIDNWEAAVARRREDVGPGATFRLARLDVEPAGIDRLVTTFRETALPKVEAIPGMKGVSLLVDRAHGRAAVGTLYADRAALDASRSTVTAIRDEATAKAGVVTRSLEEFDVLVATAVPHT